jgi:hypothetical protein
VRNIRRRKPRWAVGGHSRRDGTMLVQLERPGRAAGDLSRAAAGDGRIAFAANLRPAVEEAEAQADELNRR